MFYVPQSAPHCIQMWFSWCLHELTHHSNLIIQIWPCDGHVNQTPHYVFVHSGIVTRSPSFAFNFTFCSNGIEMGLQLVIPYSNNLFKAYRFCNNHIPLRYWITSMRGRNATLSNPSFQIFASKAFSNKKRLHHYFLW